MDKTEKGVGVVKVKGIKYMMTEVVLTLCGKHTVQCTDGVS